MIGPARFPAAALLLLPALAGAQNLRNAAFTIRYGDEGIVSLRHTDDVADTEYIAGGGVLGRVVARYRTSPQSDWREIRSQALTGSRSCAFRFRPAGMPE